MPTFGSKSVTYLEYELSKEVEKTKRRLLKLMKETRKHLQLAQVASHVQYHQSRVNLERLMDEIEEEIRDN